MMMLAIKRREVALALQVVLVLARRDTTFSCGNPVRHGQEPPKDVSPRANTGWPMIRRGTLDDCPVVPVAPSVPPRPRYYAHPCRLLAQVRAESKLPQYSSLGSPGAS